MLVVPGIGADAEDPRFAPIAACGEGGLRVFDIAFIDDKGFSERITTAPVSPLGQKFYVPTRYAMSVAAPRAPPSTW